MTDHRSPEEIEREIERERAGLTDTLETLQDRFSLDGVIRQVTDQLREHGGDLGASVSRAARDNPVALALTGVGLAWMMFGGRDKDLVPNRLTRRSYRDDRDYDHDDDMPRRTAVTHFSRSHDQGEDSPYGSAYAASRYYDSRPGMGRGMMDDSAPSWVRSFDDPYGSRSGEGRLYGVDHDSGTGSGMGDRMKGAAGTVGDAASRAGQSISGAASSAAGTVSGAASSAAGTVSGAASSAAGALSGAASSVGGALSGAAGSVGDGARSMGSTVAGGVSAAGQAISDAASQAAERAAALRARLAEGTEQLSEEARSRVVAARERAIEARRAAAVYTRQGRDKAIDLFEEQPLIAGALALAVGAAIGAALPRSRMEDAYMGEQRDALLHEAERIFAEEKEKAAAVASAAMDAARDVAKDAADGIAKVKQDADAAAPAETLAQAAADKVKEAGKRVADAAKSEAERRKLGQPDTKSTDV